MSSHHDHIKNLPAWHAARAECFDRDDYQCVDCGSTEDLQADHIVPLAVLFAEGPTPEAIEIATDPDQLTTRCGKCNRDKSDRLDGVVRPGFVAPGYEWLADLVEPVGPVLSD